MKWFVVLAAVVLALFPRPVSAGTTADITITATGIIIGAPGGFTLTYVSDYEIGIDWTKAPGAVNTMVRAAVGRYPASISDGYLVYYGAGESATDTGVGLDDTAGAVYYRAWSENADSVFSPVWAEGFVEGIGVIILGIAALMLVAIISMGIAWHQKTMIFAIIGTFLMIMTGFFAYTKMAADGDLFWGFFLGCIGMAFMGLLEATMLRPKKEVAEELDERQEILKERTERRQQKAERLRQMFGKPMSPERVAQIKSHNEFRRVAARNEAIYQKQKKGY